jgi:hypothetical protein
MRPDPTSIGDDASRAFLFESADGAYLAVTLDRAGANLPRGDSQLWIMQTAFALGVHEPVPAAIDPEPILQGLKAEGFFVWPANRTLPMGTSQ